MSKNNELNKRISWKKIILFYSYPLINFEMIVDFPYQSPNPRNVREYYG